MLSYLHLVIHENYPLFLSDFNEAWIFFHRFSWRRLILNFMKIRPVGIEFVPCRQTDRHDEANSRFSQFCERTQLRHRILTAFFPSFSTKKFRINHKVSFFGAAEIIVLLGFFFCICGILHGKENNLNFQEHVDSALDKSHNSSQSTKPRLIQNCINANPTFVIPNHFFFF